MTTSVIPAALNLAAKRAFIRTTYQAYAATLTTGIPSAAAIVALIQDPTGWLLAGVTLALAVVSPPLAGLASFASIISKGLPADYGDVTLVGQAVVSESESVADQQAALARVEAASA